MAEIYDPETNITLIQMCGVQYNGLGNSDSAFMNESKI